MERTQAVAVLHEIIDVWQESVLITSVSLDEVSQPNHYQLRIGCCLDNNSKNLVKPILDKHNLGMKIGNSFVIFYALSLQNRNAL